MEVQELITILENSFGKNSKVTNCAIRKVYSYSKQMLNCSAEEKIDRINPLLDSKHVYPKYWGAIIALSYNVLEEKAIKEIIYILDMNPKEHDMPLDLNMLKMDAGSYLYDYHKNGVVGSFPGHNAQIKTKVLPNYQQIVRYYKRKYKI